MIYANPKGRDCPPMTEVELAAWEKDAGISHRRLLDVIHAQRSALRIALDALRRSSNEDKYGNLSDESSYRVIGLEARKEILRVLGDSN